MKNNPEKSRAKLPPNPNFEERPDDEQKTAIPGNKWFAKRQTKKSVTKKLARGKFEEILDDEQKIGNFFAQHKRKIDDAIAVLTGQDLANQALQMIKKECYMLIDVADDWKCFQKKEGIQETPARIKEIQQAIDLGNKAWIKIVNKIEDIRLSECLDQTMMGSSTETSSSNTSVASDLEPSFNGLK